MLNYCLIWASNHRNILIGVIAFSLWLAAYAWYGKVDFDRYRFQRRPRRWSADMSTKTSKGGYTKP